MASSQVTDRERHLLGAEAAEMLGERKEVDDRLNQVVRERGNRQQRIEELKDEVEETRKERIAAEVVGQAPTAVATENEVAELEQEIEKLESDEDELRQRRDELDEKLQPLVRQRLQQMVEREVGAVRDVRQGLRQLAETVLSDYPDLLDALDQMRRGRDDLRRTLELLDEGRSASRRRVRALLRREMNDPDGLEVLGYLLWRMLEYSRHDSHGPLADLWAAEGPGPREGTIDNRPILTDDEIYRTTMASNVQLPLALEI